MAIANENMIANGEIPVEQPVQQPAGLSMEQLDHEFLGRGDVNVDSLRLREKYEKNLSPEELKRFDTLAPFVEEFFVLDFKGRTGKFPKGEREVPRRNLICRTILVSTKSVITGWIVSLILFINGLIPKFKSGELILKSVTPGILANDNELYFFRFSPAEILPAALLNSPSPTN